MRYVSAEELLLIHAKIIDETGGVHGVREIGLLKSIPEKPKASFGGIEMYVDIYTKSAVLCEVLANYHVFVDGNKRTAFAVLARFLYINQIEITATNDAVVKGMVEIAEKKKEISDLADWIRSNSKRK